MNEWTRAAGWLLRAVTGNPKSTLELGIATAAIIFSVGFILSPSARALGGSRTGRGYAMITGLLGLMIIMAAVLAAKLYLPLRQYESYRVTILIGTAMVAWLLIVVPLTCWLLRTGFLAALISWVLAAAAAAIVVLFVGLVFDGLAAGSRGAGRGLEHRKQIERALE